MAPDCCIGKQGLERLVLPVATAAICRTSVFAAHTRALPKKAALANETPPPSQVGLTRPTARRPKAKESTVPAFVRKSL